jgi:hypothetical protein
MSRGRASGKGRWCWPLFRIGGRGERAAGGAGAGPCETGIGLLCRGRARLRGRLQQRRAACGRAPAVVHHLRHHCGERLPAPALPVERCSRA